MRLILLIIFLLFIANLLGEEASLSDRAIERFLRQDKYLNVSHASKNLKPEDIALVLIQSTYKPAVSKPSADLARDLYEMPSFPNMSGDLVFYYQAFKYVKTVIPLNDFKGNKDDLFKEIEKKTSDKKVIIVVYSGHGSERGEMMLGSYTDYCRQLYTDCCSGQYNQYFYPPVRDDQAQEESYRHMSPDALQEWKGKYQDRWIKGGCNKYMLRPDEFQKRPAFNGKDVVLFNDSCYSGIGRQWIKPPVKMLVYAADNTETAVAYAGSGDKRFKKYVNGIDWVGGRMTIELRSRLTGNKGCTYDGKGKEIYGVISNEDLVLNLAEWTYQFNVPLDVPVTSKRQSGTQTPGAYSFSNTEQVLALPAMVYTGSECEKYVDSQTSQKWKNLDELTARYRRNISENVQNDIIKWDDYSNKLYRGELVGK